MPKAEQLSLTDAAAKKQANSNRAKKAAATTARRNKVRVGLDELQKNVDSLLELIPKKSEEAVTHIMLSSELERVQYSIDKMRIYVGK